MNAEPIGWLAASFTLLAFSQRSMLHLRLAAIGSNLSFISYGVMAQVYPVMALHIVLLPCNVFRLIQLLRHSSAVESHHDRASVNGGVPDVHYAESSALEQQIRQPLSAAILYSRALAETAGDGPDRQAVLGLLVSIDAIEKTLSSSLDGRGRHELGPIRRGADL